jgi:hypothetical protein
MPNNEKPPAANRGLSGSGALLTSQLPNTIQVFARGVKSVGVSRRVGKPPKSGGARGVVKGWSKDSRRRFREFMLEHRAPAPIYGVTLTVPGLPVSPDLWRGLMDRLIRVCDKHGFCLIWRLELQRRGQPHLHCIASPAPAGAFAKRMRPGAHGDNDVREWWRATWARLIDTLPGCPARVYVDGCGFVHVPSCSRSLLPGADVHSVDVQPDSGDRWYRYLCDHSSKSKQAQVSTWTGFRHWGVVGRAAFRSAGVGEYSMDFPQFQRVYRQLRKLSRRRIIDKRAPFGSRRAASPRRSCQGSAVWFGITPALIQRLVAWAGDEVGALPLVVVPGCPPAAFPGAST